MDQADTLSQAMAVPAKRRHDLDALRAIAMILGIVLHAALSFCVVIPWIVQDSRQHQAFGLIFSFLHGFRIPLFFLVSGYFTAMLWRKRGLKSVVWHRFRRIFVPMVLGMITIVPALNWISTKAIVSGVQKAVVSNSASMAENEILAAVRSGDLEKVKQYLAKTEDIDSLMPSYGQSLLNWACLVEQPAAVKLLLERNADANVRTIDNNTPLHTATFVGNAEIVKMLLGHGADPSLTNDNGEKPLDVVAVDWESTKSLASLFQLKLDQAKLEAGREEIALLFQNSKKESNLQKLEPSNNSGSSMPKPDIDIWTAVINDDSNALNWYIANGADLNELNPKNGASLLILAALLDRAELTGILLQHGANIDSVNRDGSTALHTAAFFGNAKTAKLLIQNGADIHIKNSYGQTPIESLAADWNTTQFIASLLKIELNKEKVETGRREIAALLRNAGAKEGGTGGGRLQYFLNQAPLLGHLWFLWFLCLFVVGFAFCASIADLFHWRGSTSGFLLSPARYLWLIPLTIIPQWFMSPAFFGPDTSTALLPIPQVFLFYAIFFGFGVLYFDARDTTGQLGQWYWVTLPLAIFVVFPLGIAFTRGVFLESGWLNPTMHKLCANLLEASFAWLMTFGSIGLFRKLFSHENKTMRYISDSSYWLYIAHLPLVIWAQWMVRDWPIPALVKFILIVVIISAFLLFTYQTLVRYTLIGTLLNGPRKRPVRM